MVMIQPQRYHGPLSGLALPCHTVLLCCTTAEKNFAHVYSEFKMIFQAKILLLDGLSISSMWLQYKFHPAE